MDDIFKTIKLISSHLPKNRFSSILSPKFKDENIITVSSDTLSFPWILNLFIFSERVNWVYNNCIKRKNIPITYRISKGKDIKAACGQLVNEGKWVQ